MKHTLLQLQAPGEEKEKQGRDLGMVCGWGLLGETSGRGERGTPTEPQEECSLETEHSPVPPAST